MDLSIYNVRQWAHLPSKFRPIKALFRIACAPYIIDVVHIIFMVIKHALISYSQDDGDPLALLSEMAHWILEVNWWLSGRFHWESTLRFIAEGYEVPRIFIDLLSRNLRRHGSQLYICPLLRLSCPQECVHCHWSALPRKIPQSSCARCQNDGCWLCGVAVVHSHPHCWPHLLQVIG